MVVPTIHTNGTSREALLDQICNAGNAVRTAIDALCDAAPNARDYYPQGDNAYQMSASEHARRVDALRAVLNELQDIAESVAR